MANYDASSTNKSKKSNRTYVDLDLDFTRHPVTNDVVKITDVDAVKRSVKILIHLLNQNNYLLNYTPMTGIFMRRKIEEVLSNYEPRASLSSIQVNEQMDRNAIDVVVNFYVLNLPNPVSVTTTLQRIR